MDRRLWVPLTGVVLLALTLLYLAPAASAGVELRTPDKNTQIKTSNLPVDVTIEIILTGSTVEQADLLIVDHGDPESDVPKILISRSAIKGHYNRPGAIPAMEAILKYINAGEFIVSAKIYNTTYENGTPREESKMIQEAQLPLSIKIQEESGPGVDLDLGKFLPYIIGVVVVIVVIITIKLVIDRGGLGLSMPGLPSLPSRPGVIPPVTGAGGLSTLGKAHDPNSEGSGLAAKGPRAQRDCPSCGTPISITSDKRPLRLTCPNLTCGKSFTLKGKSGAVAGPPRRRPRQPGASTRPVARKGKRPAAGKGAARRPKRRPTAGVKMSGARPRRPPAGAPRAPAPKAKPPAPRAKPPAPKAKPMHCPDDGTKLDHYPNAAKKYGYDSDYFCPTCELYVTPREQRKEQPSVAGPFGKAPDSVPKAEAQAQPKPAPSKSEPELPGAGEHPAGEIICPNCSAKHEVPAGSTKSIMCSCGRRLRVKQG